MYDMGEPRIKIVAMPKDTNPAGNIFGGWIMSQIDLAGSVATKDIVHDRVATVAVNSIVFKEPVFMGDAVSFYAKITKIGKTSITVDVEVTADRQTESGNICVHVTSAIVTYVVMDENNKKKKLDVNPAVLKKLDL